MEQQRRHEPHDMRALEQTPRLQASDGWAFDGFRLDRRDERLWRGHEILPLHPKAFAVLCCLLRQAGQLVTKDQILEAVWPETAVSEAVLHVAIQELRRVLGDRARTPLLIETVHGRGYRFMAPVSALVAHSGAATEEAPPRVPSSTFRRPPHFVGRDAALAQLTQWWTAARQGRRQVGIIAGEAGIGKTALVDTFVAQVSALEDLRVGHGQCVESYGTGEPYLPVLEALGRLGQGPDGSRVVSGLRQYAPSWLAQMPALLPPAEWEGLQRLVGTTGQTRMLRELTEALDALTTERPLVLVLEDLHWSDRATLEWLAYVARRPDPARLFILGTYRPVEAVVQAHPLRTILTELRQHGQCVELALDYLSEADVAAYLGERFEEPQLAANLARALHRRTTGNPLFLITVVDELVRQQVVIEGPEGWEARAGVETITAMVPATLRTLIELQLAHLSPEDQTLLEAASVAGVGCSAAAVAAALECTEEGVEARCTALAHQGQFLHAGSHAEWSDGTVTACYSFLHALYQDVLYQRIPPGRQTRWHARIGSRLAQGFGTGVGEIAAALAMHLVRGRLTQQAVPYLRLAGQQAFQRAAYQDAVAFYEQALQALDQAPTTPDTLAQAIDLRFALRGALWPLAEFGPIVDHLRAAERLAETLQDQRRLAWSLSHLTGCFRAMGEHRAAIDSGQRALTLASALKEIALQAATTLYMGIAYRSLGDYDRAIAVLTRTVVSLQGELLYERFDLPTVPSVSARAWLAYFLAERGEFTQGIVRGEEAVQLAEAVDDPSSLIVAYAGIGGLYLCKGDLHQAISVLEHGLRICQDTMLENLFLFGMVASRLGYAYALSGRIADALPLLEQATEWAPSRRADVAHRESLAWLSESYLMAGRQDEAMDLARRALELSRASNERGHQAWALHLLGDIAARREPPESALAEAYYRQALGMADELGMRPLQAHCHLGLGTLYAKIDQREQACTELAGAIDLYRAMDMTFWLPQTEATLTQVAK
jgi:DNA-binding winged helix-turn-helix (wHTH) protein/tetratricopeptide (TPR) repeat protein